MKRLRKEFGAGRLPHGRRGLKSVMDKILLETFLAPPAWEGGVEIVVTPVARLIPLVASRMGGVD